MTFDTGSAKNTGGSHMECVRHKVGQRNNDDYLAQQGEKNCLFLFVQGFKYSLADVLTIHKNESRKILFQGGNGIL